VFCPLGNAWRNKPGQYTARLGSSSRDIRLEATFSLSAQ
jgi:hypothetical protein